MLKIVFIIFGSLPSGTQGAQGHSGLYLALKYWPEDCSGLCHTSVVLGTVRCWESNIGPYVSQSCGSVIEHIFHLSEALDLIPGTAVN